MSRNESGANRSASPELGRSLADNLRRIKEETGHSEDIKTHPFRMGRDGEEPLQGVVVFTDGLSNPQPTIQMLLVMATEDMPGDPAFCLDYLKEKALGGGEIDAVDRYEQIYDKLLSGFSIVMLDGAGHALAVNTIRLNARAVEEPNVQSVVRGPREGFTEVLNWNTAMLRRKIKSPNLWIESRTMGRETRTQVAVVYIKGIARDEVIEEVRRRLDKIDIDGVLESNYIEEHIQDSVYTPFPTVFNTERPDVVAAQLLEGRVAIMVDGTPFVLCVPALFLQFFQSGEDYYQRSDFSTMIRLLRFVSFILAILTPAMYVGITTYQPELLPPTLLFNLASQREGVPFPAFLEGLIMEVLFEILREASVRMPKTVGQSISIVGTLVVGQAAVQAGLVTAGMVIVVSITAISNFVMPSFNMGISARILRFFLLIMAATFGLYGVCLGLIFIVVRLCSLQSFGVPYMSAFAPLKLGDQKDALVRLQIPGMIRRPSSFRLFNRVRQRRPR